MAITADDPVEAVLGDSKKADRFRSGLGLATVGDLLRHFPRRYLRTADLTQVDSLREGDLLSVVGEIVSCRSRRTTGGRWLTEAVVATAGPRLALTFFSKNQRMADWFVSRYAPGTRGVFVGLAGKYRGQWQITHPQMHLFEEAPPPLFPIYPLTAGLESWDIQRAAQFALDMVEIPETLPDGLRARHGLIGLAEAYRDIHRPEDFDQVEAARHRFRFEEALVLQLVMGRRRALAASEGATPRPGRAGGALEGFDTHLPFALTPGQRAVGAEIAADLSREHPMHRLLQGEVGSGKTVVALRAMLQVADAGGQAVLLAPTEVLAAQHFRTLVDLLGPLAPVELLTGSTPAAARRQILLRIASGESAVVVGTHALFHEHVQFADLGLVVVDEQHRFGVEQRAALAAKSASGAPHLLVMTATPIPRTVAMTVFGDLEVSTLGEVPAGRAPVQTTVVAVADHPAWLARVWARVREEVEKGHQAFVVVPRITETAAEPEEVAYEEDEASARTGETHQLIAMLSAVETAVPLLAEGPLAGLRLARLHGQLSSEDKDRTMRSFAAGEVDVLVSTTVIEVGVDVPNATAMVVVGAERFGVSQLHQLRGRVGRGGLPGLCLLVTESEAGAPARARLDAVASTADGFRLAELDLEQRREGDILGASQSGRRTSLSTLRVLRDADTIAEARAAAAELLSADPELASAPALQEAVLDLERTVAAEFLERS